MFINNANKKELYRNIISSLLFVMIAMPIHAQSLEQAKSYISKKDYDKAVSAFAKIIKQYPSRGDVNKWYGEALYETGQEDEAVTYLKKAAAKKVKGAYPYLGDYYMKRYKFKNAAEYYNEYILSLKSTDEDEELKYKELLSVAQRAERALAKVEKIEVVDSLKVSKTGFFKNYALGSETGHLLDFEVIGVKDEDENAVFETQRKDRRLFGKKDDSGKYSIYNSNKLIGNSWSEPTLLNGGINSESNDNYPYALTDGLTIYFASDRSGGLGGYDLYLSKYNSEKNSYLFPEKLPMPFNSPYNDYMLAIDEENNIGWFASDRFQHEDSVVIYVFIPNSERVFYNPEDIFNEDSIENLAMIKSIKSTWKHDKNYSEILDIISTIKNSEPGTVTTDFDFVINDKYIYHYVSDFKNKNALDAYKQVVAIEKAIKDNNEQLSSLRHKWSNADANMKGKLKPEILKKEEAQINLLNSLEKAENSVRKEELKILK